MLPALAPHKLLSTEMCTQNVHLKPKHLKLILYPHFGLFV